MATERAGACTATERWGWRDLGRGQMVPIGVFFSVYITVCGYSMNSAGKYLFTHEYVRECVCTNIQHIACNDYTAVSPGVRGGMVILL